MKPVAIRKFRPVAVKKARPQLQYDMQGKPSFVFGAGGGGGGGGGRSKRERALGALGGLVGVAGGALGGHRSLGSLLGSMYAGGAQGSALGGGLGRKITGRDRQAELDARAELRDAEAKRRGQERVQLREDYRNWRGPDDEKAPSAWAASRKTGKFRTGKQRDAEMREFLEDEGKGGGPRGGARYESQERKDQMAQWEKDNAQYLAEQRRHKIKTAVKEGKGPPDLSGIAGLPQPARGVGPMDDVNQQKLAQFAAIAGAEGAVRRPARPGTREGSSPALNLLAGLPVNDPSNDDPLTNPAPGPGQDDHKGEGLTGGAQSFAEFAAKNTDLTTGNPPRTERNPVAMTGTPADPTKVRQQTERILEQTGNNPLGVIDG